MNPLDANRLSDETSGTGMNFTGSFASISAHDLSGRGTPARFARFDLRPLTAAAP